MNRILFVATVACFVLLVPVLASAAELPSFCTNPTLKEKQNEALQKECRDLIEIDAVIAKAREMLDSMKAVVDGMKKANDAIGRRLDTLVPPRREREQERIPSHPSEVGRSK